MFGRKPATVLDGDDPLLTADLPARVQAAYGRLAHQYDPALREARSVRELAAERGVAEAVREHERDEQVADLATAKATALEVRKAAAELVRAEARDLVTARRALASQRRESSPHAQLAALYRVKKRVLAALAGVVLAMMLVSATNVQQNLAPGGPSEPLFWMSYFLEAGLSVVLVAFMVSGSAVARWEITERDTAIRVTEIGLLLGSIYLNVYPYMNTPTGWHWRDIAAHGAAPVAMGIALIAHALVAKRMGAAIAKASAQLPADAEDDTVARLAALTRSVSRPDTTPTDPGPGGGIDLDDELAQLVTAPVHTPDAHPTAAESAHAHPPVRTPGAHAHSEVHIESAHADEQAPARPADSTTEEPSAHPAEADAHSGQGSAHSVPAVDAQGAHEDQDAGAVTQVLDLTQLSHPPVEQPVGAEDAQGARHAHAGAREVRTVAAELVRCGVTTKSVEDVTAVLELAAAGVAPSTVARDTGVHYRTVVKLLNNARALRQPRLATNGGHVIDLERRTQR
ncbi:hypothetical protein ACWDOP_00325 [Nocardia sp. NPDC003693]